ncbi:neuropeptides capa receptor-like [Patiria miniata]|uniref:G-protein coupled receptors family 1 profile domain-containing protein n=1 Tax=Patiria miniata TaxID=46514 RepID=A0A914B3A5_PATMI|nr:neuropeptides capa receptor-like [Patiria miniata]
MGAQQSDCNPDMPPTNLTGMEQLFMPWFRDNLSVFMVTIVMPILFFVGLVGNLAFLFVMARVSWMHTVTNYYLANLAVADISFLVAAIGEKMWAYQATPLTIDTASFMGRSGCIIVHFLKNLTLFASLFLVTLVSLERFYAICKPVQHWMLSDKGRTVKLVAVTWFIALVFACLLVPANSELVAICLNWPDTDKYRSFPKVVGSCHPAAPWMLTFSLGMQTVPFTVAMVGNIILYIMIIKNLNQRVAAKEKKQATRQGSGTPAPQNVTQSHQIRNTVARMLIINGTLFFICLSPFQFTSFGTLIVDEMGSKPILKQHQKNILLIVCQTFTYVNSVVNPFVYTVTNKRYRHAFYVAFTFSRTEQRQRYSKNTSVVTTDMSTRM